MIRRGCLTEEGLTGLEPNEQFELTLCPSAGTLPYGTFSLNLHPFGTAMPLTVTRTAPARIQPVMNLG
jgi:hypothetical protein